MRAIISVTIWLSAFASIYHFASVSGINNKFQITQTMIVKRSIITCCESFQIEIGQALPNPRHIT